MWWASWPARARAFDEHDLPVGQLEDALHPVPNPLLDPDRIQPREDPSQRVVRGDPVRQLQEGAQPGIVELTEEGDGHETAGSTDDLGPDSARMSVRLCS